jgi:hypothetical protein
MPVKRLIALVLTTLVLGGPAVAFAQDTASPVASPTASGAGSNAAGDPLVGTGVSYLNEEGKEIGVVTVTEVTDPWTDFSEGVTLDKGTRYVGVEISIAATGEQIKADPYDFGLQTTDGFFYGNTSVSRDITSASIRNLESITVDVDDQIDGLVFFQVPEKAQLGRILWQPDTGRLLVVADLRSS